MEGITILDGSDTYLGWRKRIPTSDGGEEGVPTLDGGGGTYLCLIGGGVHTLDRLYCFPLEDFFVILSTYSDQKTMPKVSNG